MCLIIKHIRKFIPSYIRHLASAILRPLVPSLGPAVPWSRLNYLQITSFPTWTI